MRNKNGDSSSPMTLTRQYRTPTTLYPPPFALASSTGPALPSTRWQPLSSPAAISDGARVGLYFQWTVDGAGVTKKIAHINTTFRSVTIQNNEDKGTLSDGYYTYEVTVGDATVRLSNPSGASASTTLRQENWRRLGAAP
ncbi:hypothetical protein BKA70DRAFT_1250828 [Coprinopsis sp. MPI-PUGE-AT-0042]|nr:hypothetical protein BKA70DRAFT_1250828 [Coprinopsis sp. MPI-PUGE-AT-0042]